jgi:polyhydroxybutyrate depolymerase
MNGLRTITAPAAVGIAFVIAIAACTAHQSAGPRQQNIRDHSHTFPAKGSLSTAQSHTLALPDGRREYLIQPVRGSGRFPVVILLHGGDSDDKTVWTQTSLPTLGTRFGFIVVAPNASMNKHWNDGRGTVGEGLPSSADDIAYLRNLIARLVSHEHADSASVFMVGVSNGGIMTIRFACEEGQLLRAAGNIISNIPQKQAKSCALRKPLPWLSINGDRDPRMPFNGYAPGTLISGRPQAGLDSADQTFALFADRAGCSREVLTEPIPDIDPADGSSAEKRVRSGCAGATTSTQYVLHNAGHSMPGLAYTPIVARTRGGVNEDIDAGSAIWAHFRQTLSSQLKKTPR